MHVILPAMQTLVRGMTDSDCVLSKQSMLLGSTPSVAQRVQASAQQEGLEFEFQLQPHQPRERG